MQICCPAGRGCNAPDSDQRCALQLLERAAAQLPDAALALARWSALEECREGGGSASERRFRQRSYQRARDRALVALALLDPPSPGRARRARSPRVHPARASASTASGLPPRRLIT
jgi:hypothetical protein